MSDCCHACFWRFSNLYFLTKNLTIICLYFNINQINTAIEFDKTGRNY